MAYTFRLRDKSALSDLHKKALRYERRNKETFADARACGDTTAKILA